MSDNVALAAKAKTGDMEAFGELYQSVYKDLYKYALYSLRNPEQAEDAVAECVAEAVKGIKGLRDEALFKKWIFTILYRTIKRQFKKRYNEPVALESLPEFSDGSESLDESMSTAVSVMAELNKLPDEDRQIVMLSVIGGYSGKEIAAMVHKPHGTVRSRLSRALAKLRRSLGAENSGE